MLFIASFTLHAAVAVGTYRFGHLPPDPIGGVLFPLAYFPHWFTGDPIGRVWVKMERFGEPLPFILNSLPVAVLIVLGMDVYQWRRRRPKV
jgi:hypothetical protein